MVQYTGVWRSLVSRLTGGQEAAGSSPVTPTSTSVLIGFEYPIRTLCFVHYLHSNILTTIKLSKYNDSRGYVDIMNMKSENYFGTIVSMEECTW